MITEFFLNMFKSIIETSWGLVPESMAVPGWLTGAVDGLIGLLEAATTMGVWIPLDLAVVAAGFLINVYIGGGVVKMIRILISHITGGGGSAA